MWSKLNLPSEFPKHLTNKFNHMVKFISFLLKIEGLKN